MAGVKYKWKFMSSCNEDQKRIISKLEGLPEPDAFFEVYFYNTVSRKYLPNGTRCPVIPYEFVFSNITIDKKLFLEKQCKGILSKAYALGDALLSHDNKKYELLRNEMTEQYSVFDETTYSSVRSRGMFLAK